MKKEVEREIRKFRTELAAYGLKYSEEETQATLIGLLYRIKMRSEWLPELDHGKLIRRLSDDGYDIRRKNQAGSRWFVVEKLVWLYAPTGQHMVMEDVKQYKLFGIQAAEDLKPFGLEHGISVSVKMDGTMMHMAATSRPRLARTAAAKATIKLLSNSGYVVVCRDTPAGLQYTVELRRSVNTHKARRDRYYSVSHIGGPVAKVFVSRKEAEAYKDALLQADGAAILTLHLPTGEDRMTLYLAGEKPRQLWKGCGA